jgi:pimeloyl-ACP methyl ester carboxylesterase
MCYKARQNGDPTMRLTTPHGSQTLLAFVSGVALLASALAAGAATASPLLLVTAAGRFSCFGWSDATAVYAKGAELEARLEAAGQDVVTLEVCYGSGEASLRLRPDGATAFESTDMDADEVLAAVTAAARAQPDTRVALVGYSYGGWLAMKLADLLPADVDVVTLATIDPISTVTCSTLAYAAGASGIGAIDPGCTQSPPDLAPRFSPIAERVGAWLNFHEPDSPYLHATAIAAADQNLESRYTPPAWKTFQAHLDIAVADATWSAIGGSLGAE